MIVELVADSIMILIALRVLAVVGQLVKKVENLEVIQDQLVQIAENQGDYLDEDLDEDEENQDQRV